MENNKWVIGIDLDGTLLRGANFDENYKVSELTKKVLKAMHDEGHIVCINTGRGYGGTKPVYDSIGLPSPIINHAGAYIHNPLDENFKPIITELNPEQLADIVYEDKYALEITAVSLDTTTKSIWESEEELEELKKGLIASGARKFFEEEVYLEDHKIVSANIVYDVDDIWKLIDHLKEQYGSEMHIVDWISSTALRMGYKGIEINAAAMGKGQAVMEVAKLYNIPLENTMGIGDSPNDIDLMKTPAVGVAMNNARDEIKELADIVIDWTNEEEGVAKFLIERFNLNIEY